MKHKKAMSARVASRIETSESRRTPLPTNWGKSAVKKMIAFGFPAATKSFP
jgi:hypothetical protein